MWRVENMKKYEKLIINIIAMPQQDVVTASDPNNVYDEMIDWSDFGSVFGG